MTINTIGYCIKIDPLSQHLPNIKLLNSFLLQGTKIFVLIGTNSKFSRLNILSPK